jgi:hypothetical protein
MLKIVTPAFRGFLAKSMYTFPHIPEDIVHSFYGFWSRIVLKIGNFTQIFFELILFYVHCPYIVNYWLKMGQKWAKNGDLGKTRFLGLPASGPENDT